MSTSDSNHLSAGADQPVSLSYSETGKVRVREMATLPIEELHSRYFPRISVPSRVSNLALSHGNRPVEAELALLQELARILDVAGPEPKAVSYHLKSKHFSIRWERHTEFSVYTVIAPGLEQPFFAETAIQLLPKRWLEKLTGEVRSAMHIEIRAFPEPLPNIYTLRQLFGGHYLIAGQMQNGESQLWTALRTYQDGFSRALIFTHGNSERKMGRLLRSFLELETYSNMALLGLPIAKEIIPQVQAMETQLTALTDRVTDLKGLDDEKAILADLCELSAHIERTMANTTSRFAATSAYYELVMARIKDLNEEPVDSLRTIAKFMDRRLKPAVKTCESGRARLADMATRVNRASALLRTRVELAIQVQNQQLLQSMDKRSKLSLYVQRSVEGLSVIVIGYYIVALCRYLLGAVPDGWLPVNEDVVTAILVPVVLLSVGLGLRRAKKKIDAEIDAI